jgi:hypothetical protein
MKNYMRDYIDEIDKIIRSGEAKNIDSIIEKHLIKIKFFMHERHMHFLVTMLFALMTLITFFYTMSNFSFGLFLLTIMFLVLLVPYIFHYYKLENGVQYMYDQYDLLLQMKNKK